MGAWYETAEQRRVQARIAEVLKRAWAPLGLEMEEEPERAVIDYSFWRDGKVVALLEVKHRKFLPGVYADVILSQAKAEKMGKLAREMGIAALFAVGLLDESVWVADLSAWETWPVRREGRTRQTREATDYEEAVVQIPWGAFRYAGRMVPLGQGALGFEGADGGA